MAYAFNRLVPGPRIRVTEGDRVRFIVTNRLPEPTTVHWHGLILPNAMDGPAEITQAPIPPGGSFTYEFTTQQTGTFFYHSHSDVDRQQALGLYGALIIDPADPAEAPVADHDLVVQLQEWNEREGYTYPAMPMEGTLPNFFTINGKAYPDTERVRMAVGEELLVRFIGSSSAFITPCTSTAARSRCSRLRGQRRCIGFERLRPSTGPDRVSRGRLGRAAAAY
jgi:FtsP/CotA-like multicopper oxidase with cupredoxin domain